MTAAYVLGTGSNALDANPSLDGVQTHGAGMMRTAAPGNTQVWSLIDGRLYNLESTATAVFRNTFINQGTGAAVVSGVDPQNPARVPYGPAPESIIPRGEDWGGPANFAQQEWIAYTLELKHEIGNRFRLLLAHNGQRDSVRREKSLNDLLQNNSGFGARSLHRDISPNLPNPAGPGLIPNSRYEQFFIHHHRLLNNDGRDELNPLLREPFFNLNDTRDRTSTGTEAELLFNFGRAWTARLAYSENSVIFTGFFPLVRARLGEARAAAAARGLDATVATLTTADYLEQQEEDARATDRRTANATLRYSFTQGRLNGLSLGLAAHEPGHAADAPTAV
jgi:hypothetical protein